VKNTSAFCCSAGIERVVGGFHRLKDRRSALDLLRADGVEDLRLAVVTSWS
jgi:hypothetical protein